MLSQNDFVADRNRRKQRILPSQLTGGMKDNFTPAMSMDFNKIFPANGIEGQCISMFLHVGQFC